MIGQKKGGSDGISEEALCAEYGAVYHYALAMCRNEQEAQDIVQETFLKAMRAVGKFKGESSLYTWLCSIAKNLWTDKCRRSGRELPSDEWSPANEDSGQSVEQLLAEKDTLRLVHKVLHSLDEPYKEVFSLRVFGELPYADIAELFGKTESWARVTYYRAKKMIILKLREDDLL